MNQKKIADFKQSYPSSQGMNANAKFSYLSSAKHLQSCMTNSLISRKGLEFYLRRTFEAETPLESYNFYRETDSNKLKILVEGILSAISDDNEYPELYEDYDTMNPQKNEMNTNIAPQLRDLISKINSAAHSIQVIKKTEDKLLRGLKRDASPRFAPDPDELDFIIQENSNLLSLMNEVLADAEAIADQAENNPKDVLSQIKNLDYTLSPGKKNHLRTNESNIESDMAISRHIEADDKQKKKKHSSYFEEESQATRPNLSNPRGKSDLKRLDMNKVYELLPKADNISLNKILEILKNANEIDTTSRLLTTESTFHRTATSPSNFREGTGTTQHFFENSADLLMNREKDQLIRDLRLKNEELEIKLEEHRINRELLEKEITEKRNEFKLLLSRRKTEKESTEKDYIQMVQKLENDRHNLIRERENLVQQLIEQKYLNKTKTQQIEEIKDQYITERERLLKRLRAQEEQLEKNRDYLLKKFKEKEEELEKQKEILIKRYSEKNNDRDKNSDKLVAKLEERILELEQERKELKKKLQEKEDDIANIKQLHEQKLEGLNKELQDQKEGLLKELRDSNKFKEQLNMILVENMDLKEKVATLTTENKNIGDLYEEHAKRFSNEQQTLMKEVAHFEIQNEENMKKLNFELETMGKENKILKLKNEELELITSKLRRTLEGIKRNRDDESFQIESTYPTKTKKSYRLDSDVMDYIHKSREERLRSPKESNREDEFSEMQFLKKKQKNRYEFPKPQAKSSYTNEYIETVIEDLEESKNLRQDLINGLRKSQTDDRRVTFADLKDDKKTISERKSKRDFNRSEDFGYLPKSFSAKKQNMNNSFSYQALKKSEF